MNCSLKTPYGAPLLIGVVLLSSSCGGGSQQEAFVEDLTVAGPELEAQLSSLAPTSPDSIPSLGSAEYGGYFVGQLSGVREGQAFGIAELTANFDDGKIGGSFEMMGYWTDGSQQNLGAHHINNALIGDGSFLAFLSSPFGTSEGLATGRLVGPVYEGVVLEIDGSMGYWGTDPTGQLYYGALDYDGKISAVR